MIRVRVSVHGKVERELDADRELVVGRKAPADIVVADGQVSSRHARLRPDGDRLLVTDLGSTNGTRIDGGEPLARDVEVPLAPGQKLVVGPAVIEVVPPRDVESSGTFGKAEKTVVVGKGAMESLLVNIAKFQASQARLVLGAEHAKGVIDLKEMEVVVGRDAASAQVVVPHQSVSSKHAKLGFEHGRFVLEDLGSSNGTFVDGVRITAPVPLEPQTAVTFGTVDCLFVARAPEAGGAEGAADPHAEVLATTRSTSARRRSSRRARRSPSTARPAARWARSS
jgi:pSer/pThr/pTyr-binding forkhead associated (FHA) protein